MIFIKKIRAGRTMTESILTRRQALAGLAGLLAYFSLWAALPAALAASFPLDVVEGIYWSINDRLL